MTSTTKCVSSLQDINGEDADLSYYGKLVDIIELNYYGKFVTLFKCNWADTTSNKGFVKDVQDFNLVNFNRLIHTSEQEEHEPHIESSQAQMGYYVNDDIAKGWSVIVHLKPRDLYDMGEDIDDETCEHEPFVEQELGKFFENDDVNIQLARDDTDDTIIDENTDEYHGNMSDQYK